MDMKEKYGAESVVFAQGTGRDIAAYITRLCWSFGSPNYTGFLSGQCCYLPRIAGMAATTGAPWIPDAAQQFPERYDHPDYEVPEVMFIWGNYPLKSNIEGFYGHWVIDLMKRGMKIVTVDPKVTWLATKSELHLRVRPGTDAALALGMMKVIIDEDLYDHEFVDNWCYGFEELKERADEFDTKRVSEITWVPEDKIVAAARMLGNAKNSTLQWGVAVDMTREAMPAGQAILALWEITGNMERPGGMIVAPEILSVAGGWGREILGPEQEAKRIGIQDYPLFNFGFAVSQPDETVKTIETGVPYEIHGAWLQTTNPIACMGADPQRLYNALNKLDFIVVVDLFKTPTIAALADVVLPACTFPERNGIAFVSGAQRGSTINKVTDVGECRSDMQINLELGKRWNPEAWPWDNVDEMFTDMLKPTEMSFEELQSVAPAYQPIEYYRYEKGMLRKDGQPGFNTPDGPHRAVEQLLQPGRPRPAAVLRGARARPRFHARAHGRVSAGHDERRPHLEHVPFRASPDRAHAPLPSLADDGDPSRDGREVRHQGRRLGVDGRPHGPRQAQGEAHAHHGPPHRLVRPRLVVPRGRPGEVLRRVRPQHQQHHPVDPGQERLRIELQELHLQGLQSGRGGINHGEVRNPGRCAMVLGLP